MDREERTKRIAELTAKGAEFCNLCFEEMGFPIVTTIDHPIRFRGGAAYTEGAGQTCGDCNRKLAAKQKA